MNNTTNTAPRWREAWLGGSEAAENKLFDELVGRMHDVQHRNLAQTSGGRNLRTLHAEILAGVDNAVLAVSPDIPSDLAQHHFQPGAQIRCTVRLSNASGVPHGGSKRDMRGAALRLHLPGGGVHELLLTNFPISHARDAEQFVDFACIMSGPKALVLPRLLFTLGPAETLRVLRNLSTATGVTRRLADESFWSRGALLWGDAGPVRLKLHPAARSNPDGPAPSDLAADFATQLAAHDVVYQLSAQRFVDEATTPIEDGCTGWAEGAVPFVKLATLTISRRDLASAQAIAMREAVDATPFNPWNAPSASRPLGNLNRVRRTVYDASARNWSGNK
ncbi:hypothetical protein ACO2Q9_10600 [Variovorax sp. VNK109]|uniref:hypothetical protein n=1 Tax=Variovorax sp. VNK109 TaxID=3400919 RepID=UPI003C0201DE